MGLSVSQLRERFEQAVELIPFSDCHYWTGRLNDNGISAHVVADIKRGATYASVTGHRR